MELLQRAARLDPRSGIIRYNIAERYIDTGNFEQALDWFLQAATATEPPFLLAYEAICDMFMNLGQFDVAARWAKALVEVHPEVEASHHAVLHALRELGARDEMRRALEVFPSDQKGDPDRPFLWNRLNQSARLALAEGDYLSANQFAQTFRQEFLEPLTDLSAIPSWTAMLDIEALADVRRGQPERALERYSRLLPNQDDWHYDNHAATVRTPVLITVLHRLTGDEPACERG